MTLKGRFSIPHPFGLVLRNLQQEIPKVPWNEHVKAFGFFVVVV